MPSVFLFCVLLGIFGRIHCANESPVINSSTIRIESSTDMSTTTARPTTTSVKIPTTTRRNLAKCCPWHAIFNLPSSDSCQKCFEDLCNRKVKKEELCSSVERARDIANLISRIKDKNQSNKDRMSYFLTLGRRSNEPRVVEWIKKYLFPDQSKWSNKTHDQLLQMISDMLDGIKYMCYQSEKNEICKYLNSLPSPFPDVKITMSAEFSNRKCSDIGVIFEDLPTIKRCTTVLSANCDGSSNNSPSLCDQFNCANSYMSFILHHYVDPKKPTDEIVKKTAEDFFKIPICKESGLVINKSMPYIEKDLSHLREKIWGACHFTEENCNNYIGGSYKTFGITVVKELLQSSCSDPEVVVINPSFGLFKFCSRLEDELRNQTSSQSPFNAIRKIEKDYKRLRNNITNMGVIKELCNKIFLSDEPLKTDKRDSAPWIFLKLLMRHTESYRKALFHVCGLGYRKPFTSDHCNFMVSNWTVVEVEKAVNELCFPKDDEDDEDDSYFSACADIAPQLSPDSQIYRTWHALLLFRSVDWIDLSSALDYRLSSQCTDPLARCDEFDQRIVKNFDYISDVIHFLCASRSENPNCTDYLNKMYDHNQTAYIHMLETSCMDEASVESFEGGFLMCKNIYINDCQQKNSTHCEKFNFILKYQKTMNHWFEDYGQDDIANNVKKLLLLRTNDKQRADTYVGMVTSKKEAMNQMIHFACENSSNLHSIDSCDWVLKNVIPNHKNPTITFHSVIYLCYNVNRQNVFMHQNKNMCDWLWDRLCAHGEANNICTAHYEYLWTMNRLNEYKQNIGSIDSLLQMKCDKKDSDDGVPTEITDMSCDMAIEKVEMNENMLRTIITMTRIETPSYVGRLLTRKITREPRFVEDYCMPNLLRIVKSEGTPGINYCFKLYLTRPVVKIVKEFEIWMELAKEYVLIQNALRSKKPLLLNGLQFYIDNIDNESEMLTMNRKYSEIVYFDIPEIRRVILHRTCNVNRDKCAFWLKKFYEKNLYQSSYEEWCSTKHQQSTKLCENMYINCKFVRKDCSKITGVFLNVYFNPLACQKQATATCKVFVEEFCIKRKRDFRCKILFDRMGAKKLIDLMPECEQEKKTRTCFLIFDALKASPSATLIADVFRGYCTGDAFYETACNRIKDFCFEVPKVGCYDVMQVYYPFWMDILVFCMKMSIFAFLFAVILFCKRQRNHRRIMEA